VSQDDKQQAAPPLGINLGIEHDEPSVIVEVRESQNPSPHDAYLDHPGSEATSTTIN